jgi:hypothetical protein
LHIINRNFIFTRHEVTNQWENNFGKGFG